ncbi:hypothetical protein SNE40_017848 [Patella caerulea]|uniref:Homeobox domain-containing protein n=1 Tax=Patella caerulea TaxID=87958 RepID=A0AAN8JBW1_PATCE
MSVSSCISDSDDSSCNREAYDSIHKLAMIQLQPPRNPNKPFTSFSIRDILASPSPKEVIRTPSPRERLSPRDRLSGNSPRQILSRPYNRGRLSVSLSNSRIVRPWDNIAESESSSDEEINVDDDDEDEEAPSPCLKSVSPLDALMAMTNKTFQGLDHSDNSEAKRREQSALFGKNQPPKKRRKSRTAFTNQQIYELEKRFLYQKYLTPADRDEIAQNLGLTNAQVITWFQNRRAKLKRDLEELKNDVTATKSIDPSLPLDVDISKVADTLIIASRSPSHSSRSPTSSNPCSEKSPSKVHHEASDDEEEDIDMSDEQTT